MKKSRLDDKATAEALELFNRDRAVLVEYGLPVLDVVFQDLSCCCIGVYLLLELHGLFS